MLRFWCSSLSISCSDLFWFTELKARTVTHCEVEWTRALLVTLAPAATVYTLLSDCLLCFSKPFSPQRNITPLLAHLLEQHCWKIIRRGADMVNCGHSRERGEAGPVRRAWGHSDSAFCVITRIRFKVSVKQICRDTLIPSLKIVSGQPFIENRHSASFHPSAKSWLGFGVVGVGGAMR